MIDFTNSLVAGLFCLILAGMIKNAIDVSRLNANVKGLWRRVDDLRGAVDRNGLKGGP